MTVCPRCGEANTEPARFCSACGEGLDRAARPREERKVVSVLFVDLVGFTSRSDRADPEDVRDLLQRYHRVAREHVERFGGTVEKFIGDAVMAVFGAPIAHTDDPERAVRCALRTLEAVAELAAADPRWGLGARAAVTTGEAVVSIGSGHERGEPLALGDVVNTASRLQASAPPGRLVVGVETYRATRELIRYEPLAPVRAKGKRDPVEAWLAVEPLAAPAERLRTTPMVGRDRELSLLRLLWERALAEHRPHLVTVVGPPGIGKSRLTLEFAAAVERSGGRTLRGRCLPYDTREVFGAFAQQVKSIAGVFEQDDAATARTKLAGAARALLPEAEADEATRSLSLMLGLGLDPPVDERLLLFYAARRLVERLGAEQPTLLVFEDVHWSDASQLDLIEYVAAHARGTPVVMLALARPEFLESRPGWGGGVLAQTTIALDPLRDGDAALLVGHLIDASLSDAVGRLVHVADGNPLFLEELSAALVEGADPARELPTTVRAAIAARIDALPPERRDDLLAAAVVGKTFWKGALRALGRSGDLDAALDMLEARDLIHREPSSRVRGDTEFSFRHMLIRDVCYATLPRAERRTAHEAVARFVEEVAGETDREVAWLLAHHWKEAGDIRRAVDYLLLAADRAQEALAEGEAMDLFAQALDLAVDDAERTRIALLRALALVRLENFEAALEQLEPLLPSLDGSDRLEALLGVARSCHWTERTGRALEAAQQAVDAAEAAGALAFVGPALARLSQAHAMRGDTGDLERATALGERALIEWVPGTRAGDLAEHEHLLADQYYWVGGYDRALQLSRAARDRAVDPASAEALLRGGGMEGLLLTAKGRYEEAVTAYDTVIALGRELGRPVRVLLNYSTIAFRELYDLDEARRRSEESLTQQGRLASFHMPWMNAVVDLVHTDLLAGEIGAAGRRWREIYGDVMATPAWERWYLGGKLAAFRAEIALASEGAEAAAEWAARAIDMARPVHRRKYEAVARGVLGRALLTLGRGPDAITELRAAASGAEALGNPAGRWMAWADLGRALQTTGDDDGAADAFSRAVAIIRDTAASLAPARASRFMAAAPVAAVVAAGV